jgi:acetolactate synthase-1/3 small subunit
MKNVIIELIVRNHPGVMSQITGLFSRRAFNLEGILCAALGSTDSSRIFLLVGDDGKLEQITRQLGKLYDVFEITRHGEDETQLFDRLNALFSEVAGIGKTLAL